MSGSRSIISILFLSGGLAACDADPVSQQRSPEPGVATPEAVVGALNAHDAHGSPHVAVVDDCDASDPSWGASGGCALRGGAVTNAEFGAFLGSPLSLAVVGHTAWRMEPSYLRAADGMSILVRNVGGRTHTFTPVAAYGGGRVGPFNIGLTPAPECAPATPDPYLLPAGGQLQLDNLTSGNHRFQCCFHPWMRAVIKVQ